MATQQNVCIEDVDYKLIECIVYNNNGITTNNIVTIYNNNSNKTIDGIKYVITDNIVEKVIEMLTNFPCSFQNFAEYFKENNKWFIKINDIEKFNKYKNKD